MKSLLKKIFRPIINLFRRVSPLMRNIVKLQADISNQARMLEEIKQLTHWVDEKTNTLVNENLSREYFNIALAKTYSSICRAGGMYDASCEKRILLLNDTFNSYHHGCSATSMAIRRKCEDAGLLVESIHLLDLYAMKPLDRKTVANFCSEEQFLKWKQDNLLLAEKIAMCEQVVVNGEGCISIYNDDTVKLLFLIYILAERFHKEVFLINTSVLSEASLSVAEANDYENLLRCAIRNTKGCFVREGKSLSLMNGLLPGKAELSFDSLPLYIRDYYQEIRLLSEEDYCVIASGNNLPVWYTDFITAIFPDLENSGIKKIVVLSSDVMISVKEEDAVIFSSLTETLGKARVLLCSVKTTDEWFSVIQNASFLLSGRFHHTLAALSFGVPFAAFPTNTQKLSGMLELIKKQDHLLTTQSLDAAVEAFKRRKEEGILLCGSNASEIAQIEKLAERQFAFLNC